MARYFFDTEDGVSHRDEVGLEFATDGAAKLAAIQYIGELLADRPAMLCGANGLVLTVMDESRRVAFVVQTNVTTDIAN